MDAREDVLTPSARVRTGRGPTGIATGFGSLWVSNERSGTVARVDPESGAVVARVRLGTRIAPIVTGEGFVWVASFAGTIYKVSPRTNASVGKVRVGSEPNMVAGLGALWVTQGDRLLKLDPSTLKTLERVTIEQPIGAPRLGDSAPAIWGHSVWVPHSFNKVSRIHARTMKSHEHEVGYGPRLASNAEGLWIGTYNSAEENGTVVQVLPDEQIREAATGAWSIKHLAVSRSSIWMRTDADALVQVDRETGAVREFTIADRGYPGDIHMASGLLSLANSASDELWLVRQDQS